MAHLEGRLSSKRCDFTARNTVLDSFRVKRTLSMLWTEMQTVNSFTYCTLATAPLEATMIFGSKPTTTTSIYSQHLPEEWVLKPSAVALSPTQLPTFSNHHAASPMEKRALHPSTAHFVQILRYSLAVLCPHK